MFRKVRLTRWTRPTLCLTALFGIFSISASSTVIDFEALGDNTPVRDFYIAQGVTFSLATAITAGLSLNELEFPPKSGVNVAYDNTGPVVIQFATPMSQAHAFFTYTEPLTISAIDSSGSIISVVHSGFDNNTAISGDAGSSPNENLGFSNFSISRLLVEGDPNGSSFVFDDLSFTTASVPEPSAFMLIGTGLLIFGVGARRFRKHWLSFLGLVTMIFAVEHANAQSRPSPPRHASVFTAAAIPAAAISEFSASPSAIPNDIATTVVIQAKVSGQGILPNGVVVQQIDSLGKIIRSIGSLHDDGNDGDVTSGDGIFSGSFSLKEPQVGLIRIRVSVAIRNQLLRVISDPISLNVSSEVTVFSSTGDLWAGIDETGVSIYFANLPSGTVRLQVMRSAAGQNNWQKVIDVDYDPNSFSLPLFDAISGSTSPFDYRLLALDSAGNQLRDLGIVTVPRYINPFPEQPTATNALSLAKQVAAAAVNPLANSAFIADDVMEDPSAMTPQQILDVFTEWGSFLKTPDLTSTIADVDGTPFNPAMLIYQLAQFYVINPQLILATLQKESSAIKSHTIPPQPPDSFMGAKGCTKTLISQLSCGTRRYRQFLTEIDTLGHTAAGGWAPHKQNFTCAGTGCAQEKLPVTPANRATAALWQYNPVVGSGWGGAGFGQAGFVQIWYPSLFRNLVHIIRWQDCGLCPSAPEYEPTDPLQRGETIQFGASLTPTENGQQSVSQHGLSGGLPPNSSFTITADCALNTWDSYNQRVDNSTGYWDVFVFNVSARKYWLMDYTDPIVPPNSSSPTFIFGGSKYGDGLPDTFSKLLTLTFPASSNADTYLNFILDTATLPEADSNYPSWGHCDIKHIYPATKPGLVGIIKMPQ